MQRLRMGLIAGATMIAASATAGAQMRGPSSIPAGFQPPAGMCRVWIDGVPPGRQPAPTDCVTARASLRPNTRLVYGPALRTNDGRSGTYDPRYDNRGQGGWQNGRDDRDDGRYDRLSEKQRRELEKERRKREREREKAWKKGRGHGDRDRDDDRDDDHDRGREHDRDRGNRGVYDNRAPQQGTWGRNGGSTTDRTQCVDVNRDGVCDNQRGVGRVRVP